MNAAQALLRLKYPLSVGLEDTIAEAANTVSRRVTCSPTVQIFHDVTYRHWITVTDKDCQPGHLSVLCCNQMIPSNACLQDISKYFRLQTRTITVNLLNVVKQQGNGNCGLFAVAFADTILNESHPCNAIFSECHAFSSGNLFCNWFIDCISYNVVQVRA
jgi:hypothetical protein